MLRWALALAFLLTWLSAARGEEPETSPEPASLPVRIRQATARAAKALASASPDDEERTLVAFALVRAGDAQDRAVARRHIEGWWQEARRGRSHGRSANYQLALAVSALDGLGLERIDEAAPRSTLARYGMKPLDPVVRKIFDVATQGLLNGRCETRGGGLAWSYGTTGLLLALDGRKTMARPTVDWRADTPWDNSNTQFSVLALHDAARRGFSIPGDVISGVGRHFLQVGVRRRPKTEEATGFTDRPALGASANAVAGPRSGLPGAGREEARAAADPPGPSAGGTLARPAPETRDRPGGLRAPPLPPGSPVPNAWRWVYTHDTDRVPQESSDAMTFAGLSSLAVVRNLVGQPDERLEAVLEGGLVAVDEALQAWRATTPRGVADANDHWGGYTLYSLEKALDLLEVTRIHGKDWFAPLAESVLEAQRADGTWGDARSTAFLILFLSRATLSTQRVDVVPSAGPDRTATGPHDPGK